MTASPRNLPGRRDLLMGLGAGAASLALPRPAAASRLEKSLAPKARLWERWTRHGSGSTLRIDHAPWDEFLRRHVQVRERGPNLIAYGAVPDADRAMLDAYVRGLEHVAVSTLDRPEQQAYWINLYNAVTLRVVLAHYPVASIRDIDISPGLFASGPWGRDLVTVEGEGLSLDDIEHRILRPIWRDPRIHYAVNCAAVGCPSLQPEAFTAENTERLFEAGASTFVNDSRGVAVGDNGLVISKIYLWFQADFGDTDAGVLAHLAQYAAPPLAAWLAQAGKIDDFAYDWSLNDAAPS